MRAAFAVGARSRSLDSVSRGLLVVKAPRGTVCERFSEALSAMIAYRPGKEELAALDQDADTKKQAAPPAAAIGGATRVRPTNRASSHAGRPTRRGSR